MATWIAHLRIAERLLDRIEGLDPAYFAIGNIAPDAGIPDENWEHFNPPSEVSHFKLSGGADFALADLAFFRQHLQPLREQKVDSERFAYLLGYFFHLVTDNLWAQAVGRPTHERFAEAFAGDPDFIWEVKRDWYGLDFEYVRENPDSIFWRVFLDCRYDADFLDFMPPEAVQERLDYIKDFYQRTDEKVEAHYIQHPGCFLTQKEMDDFIQEASGRLIRIYQALWQENCVVPAQTSALGLDIFD